MMSGIKVGVDFAILPGGTRREGDGPEGTGAADPSWLRERGEGPVRGQDGAVVADRESLRVADAEGEDAGGALGQRAGSLAEHGDAIEAALLAGTAGIDLTAEPEAQVALVESYTSGQGGLGVESGFNITVEFEGTWTEALQARFVLAAEYLSSLILGDVADWGGIDDIVITATLESIDGAGGVLGQAGPTGTRFTNDLPFAGIMEFDSADAADFDRQGLFDDIVIHEMLHTLGFGTVWGSLGLTAGTLFFDDMVFTGTNANIAFKALFPELWKAHQDGVPVETDGGSGTAGGHWDDATFGNELMTGYIDDANHVSGMTVAALEDMGYDTVFDASDPTAAVLQPDDLLAGPGPAGPGSGPAPGPAPEPEPAPRPGPGDDVSVVESHDDGVEEKEGAGIDTVQAFISYELGANVENLVLLGTAELRGTGNGLDNRITGNGARNELRGKGGDDSLRGEGGKDRLEGDGGNDALFGGAKADALRGGKGRDELQGDGGNDDFVFAGLKDSGTTGGTRDRILDFGGKDDIVLTEIDAVRGRSGNQDFELDDGGRFEAGEIRFREVRAGLLVELNVDDDAQAEMSILLKGFDGRLNESDFVF